MKLGTIAILSVPADNLSIKYHYHHYHDYDNCYDIDDDYYC